jgi:hypothetical protein
MLLGEKSLDCKLKFRDFINDAEKIAFPKKLIFNLFKFFLVHNVEIIFVSVLRG